MESCIEVVGQYLGVGASEAVIKPFKSPPILHLATHGFLIDYSEHSPQDHRPGAREDLQPIHTDSCWAPEALSFANPLLRAGLGLSGANATARRPPEGNVDDGIITALESSGPHLWGTDLVVLSACEMGVGEISRGDGVFGLRRALQLAGVRAVIMSLWSIPDSETVAIMADFYRSPRAGARTARALRDALLSRLWVRRQLTGAALLCCWGASIAFGSPG